MAYSYQEREIQETENSPEFHMTDFVHHTEDFLDKRWGSANDRKRVLGLFLEVIKEASVIPVSAAISLR